MRRRRILGVVMIVIGVMWLVGQIGDFGGGRGEHGRGESARSAAPAMPKFNADDGEMGGHMNFGRDWGNDWHGGGHHWGGFWKLPLFLLAGALFFAMRRGRRFGRHRRDHGDTSTATIYRF